MKTKENKQEKHQADASQKRKVDEHGQARRQVFKEEHNILPIQASIGSNNKNLHYRECREAFSDDGQTLSINNSLPSDLPSRELLPDLQHVNL